jgi:hypothetical protein
MKVHVVNLTNQRDIRKPRKLKEEIQTKMMFTVFKSVG